MSEPLQIVFAIILITLLLLLMAAAMAALLVVNANRRVKHRLDLEAAQRKLQEEVVRAEREATRQTMHHLGIELHDNVGQLLTVARVGLETAAEEGQPRLIESAREALDLAITELRNVAQGLRNDHWKKRSFAEAIAHEAERIERVVRISAQMQVHGEPREMDADTSTILYRIFQEVVNNTLKHSRGDALRIRFDYGPPFTLVVADNGRGFDPEATQGNGGLPTLRHRCELINFTAQCASGPGQGCVWTFTENTAPAAGARQRAHAT
ncbi:MAG TPA: histidine kinase [Flavobacteriales bacterium]|nr:histidine kinase [Flavobacteriales bacterium]